MPTKISICAQPQDPTLAFAGTELSRYLTAMQLDHLHIQLDIHAPDPNQDAYTLRAEGPQVHLSGTNPRSLLYAAYDYLERLGCRWLRPGTDGEIVPIHTGPLPTIDITEAADYSYRTICIEGACSYQHARDLIDWAAKRRMNGYFMQFDTGMTFWRSWYEHKLNPHWTTDSTPFTNTSAEIITHRLRHDIALRGWKFEHVGHGWTSRAVGIPGESWDVVDLDLTPEQTQMLAQLNGKRQYFHGIPLNTNLCYGNPHVRQRLIQEILLYATQNPTTDLLHIWLADGKNNHCECDLCTPQRPSDWYVTLLNELDTALADAKSPLRIVFLIYVDLLWPPQQQIIANPDRFVLMFAPITRSFQSSFDSVTIPDTPLPPYQRNNLDFPTDVGANLQLLQAWQTAFHGDTFDFDYHLTWACYYDLSQVNIARILNRDIRALADLNMQGFNSCQVQRTGFPHNLIMETLALTLWDRQADFDTHAAAWYAAAFGPAGPQVADYFATYSHLWAPIFEPVYIPHRHAERITKGLGNLNTITQLTAKTRALIPADTTTLAKPIAKSWQYLTHFLDLQQHLIPAFRAYLNADPDTQQAFDTLYAWLRAHEPILHPGIDIFRLLEVLQYRPNELQAYLHPQQKIQTSQFIS